MASTASATFMDNAGEGGACMREPQQQSRRGQGRAQALSGHERAAMAHVSIAAAGERRTHEAKVRKRRLLYLGCEDQEVNPAEMICSASTDDATDGLMCKTPHSDR